MNAWMLGEWWHALPKVNASLNSASALLLLIGYIMIRRRNVVVHVTMMLSALLASAAFLACYLTYHAMKARHGELVTRFPHGSWRPWYLALLASHTLLAIVVLPLVGITLTMALSRRWPRHRRWARVTFPVWLYVSITGVAVYWMLYHLAPTLSR